MSRFTSLIEYLSFQGRASLFPITPITWICKLSLDLNNDILPV